MDYTAPEHRVTAGRTLRIMPGTRVRIFPDAKGEVGLQAEAPPKAAELLVRGELYAEGTPEAQVVFEPGDAGGEGSGFAWAGIVFDGGDGRILHSLITGAENGGQPQICA